LWGVRGTQDGSTDHATGTSDGDVHVSLDRDMHSPSGQMIWKCPDCGAIIRYEDYKLALAGVEFECHACSRALVVDKSADKVIVVSGSKPIQKRA
jgi:predicted Zn finger-like uncharacterized protein